jgi:hypothetical protein
MKYVVIGFASVFIPGVIAALIWAAVNGVLH